MRNKLKQLLQKERGEFIQVFDRFPDGIMIHRQGVICYINKYFGNFLGCDPAELIGKNAFCTVYEPQREAMKLRASALDKKTGKFNIPVEVSFQKIRSDEIVKGECTSMSFSYEGLESVMVIIRDLSERKKYEMHLLANDRLSSLGLLAAGVGHEINNPLCYVMMKVDSISNKLKKNGDIANLKQLLEIDYGLTQIQNVVKDLKLLSRSPDDKCLPVNVQKSIEHAISMSRNEMQHRAQIEVKLSETPLVLANEGQLTQIFLNLLINAAHAIKPGQTDKNKISITSHSRNGEVQVQVCDTGSGICDEVKKSLFKPFFSTKPIGQGTGLGLSICQSIVSRYKGRIHFESELGKGTTFTVTFPAAVTAATRLSEIKKNDASKNRDYQARVLIIDDEEMLLETLVSNVGTEYKTTGKSAGKEALDHILAGNDFDVIICDLMMPNMGGMEFYELICQQASHLKNKVVFLTGGSFTESTDNFLRQSGIVCCEKPIRVEDLFQVIEDVILKSAGFEILNSTA